MPLSLDDSLSTEWLFHYTNTNFFHVMPLLRIARVFTLSLDDSVTVITRASWSISIVLVHCESYVKYTSIFGISWGPNTNLCGFAQKVYELDADCVWKEKGVGYVSCNGVCIYVRGEEDDDVILETRILPAGDDDDVYKKQQACRNCTSSYACTSWWNTAIVWTLLSIPRLMETCIFSHLRIYIVAGLKLFVLKKPHLKQ